MTDPRTRTTRQEESSPEPRARDACPECDGTLVSDGDSAGTVCADCGLVVEDREFDRGPEWRAYDQRERDRKSRVGAPTPQLLHDKGLSTMIGWQDR
ncbi:MAG: TFIIB-type zinc ribbon-containing protein, partial [Halobacteriales archaeon]